MQKSELYAALIWVIATVFAFMVWDSVFWMCMDKGPEGQ